MVQDGKKHSTMSNLKSCLNIVFECALDDDIITKIPAKNLQVPQTESKKRTAMCCLIQAWELGKWQQYWNKRGDDAAPGADVL